MIRKLKPNTLRSYLTLVITSIVMLIVIVGGIFFYTRTYNILYESQQHAIDQQLYQINTKVEEQIGYVDSIYTMFLSNNMIHDALEPISAGSGDKLMVERQMNYLLINSYLWQENYISTIYIFGLEDTYCTFSSSYQRNSVELNNKVLDSIPPSHTSLVIKSLAEDENTLYFARNIFSSNTGKYIATIIININKKTWIDYFNETTGQDWIVYLYNEEMELFTGDYSDNRLPDLKKEISAIKKHQQHIKDISFGQEAFLIAANTLSQWNITSCVAAPKSQLYQELNTTLKTYIWVLSGISIAAVLLSIALSRMIIRPIQKMIYHINNIAESEEKQLPMLDIFDEFNHIVLALNNMLNQLNAYYEDNLEKHMLLKNAEIHELQAQMDPHFMFNTLNTIAWKAQMADDEEVYQMVISLGEMLKSNIYTRNVTYIKLGDELRYVKFYTYLQEMRFEDKFHVVLQADSELYRYYVPCFCIQPLVENAFIHGLEPKKGNGRLIINIISHADTMEISVIDDGIGFRHIPDIDEIQPSAEDSHTHIGLKNLNRRLFLLFGKDACLHIKSTPNVCTIISFTIPLKSEV